MKIVALLDACRKVELVPRGVIFFAVVVAGLEKVAPVEVKFPHILAHGIPPHPASCPIADVVINISVVNQSSVPLVQVCPVLVDPYSMLD